MLVIGNSKRGKNGVASSVYNCVTNSKSGKINQPSSSSTKSCSSILTHEKCRGKKKNPGKTKSEPVVETCEEDGWERIDEKDIVDKFWSFVELYCGEVKNENIKYLEQLLRESEESDDYFKLPGLGVHYKKKLNLNNNKRVSSRKSRLLDGVEKQVENTDDENRTHLNVREKRRGSSPFNLNYFEKSPKKTKNNSAEHQEDSRDYGYLSEKLVSCLIDESESSNSIESFNSCETVTASSHDSSEFSNGLCNGISLVNNSNNSNGSVCPKNELIDFSNENFDNIRKELDELCMINIDDEQFHDALDHFLVDKNDDDFDNLEDWFKFDFNILQLNGITNGNGKIPIKNGSVKNFEHNNHSGSETENEDNLNDKNEDEIKAEMIRCQNELRRISSSNQTSIQRLIDQARRHVKKQRLLKKLNEEDALMLDSFRKILSSKQKKKYFSDREEDIALKLLKERSILCKKVDSLDVDDID